MKKFIIIIAILITASVSLSAQTQYHIEKGVLVEGTAKKKAKKQTKTLDTVTIKGKVYPIYKGSRGGLFIVRTSKKGNTYKQYLKK